MAKKSVKPKSRKAKSNVLKKVRPEFSFMIVNGKNVRDLPALALEIENLDDNMFRHHVNETKNDFANWVREVIGEIELADALMGISTKKDTQLQILRHIVKSIG